MNNFSRLSLLILMCAGCGLLFFVFPADLHAQNASLEFVRDAGADRVYEVGDTVEIVFIATLGGVPQANVVLRITTNGIGDLRISNGGRTDLLGLVRVTGKILLSDAFIQAHWIEIGKSARAHFITAEDSVSPALIVVNSPDPKTSLKIGDAFTQTITIENRASRFPTLPLSAWRMDIVYNPEILQVVEVTEGDLLKKNKVNTYYDEGLSRGKVSVLQSRPGNARAPAPEGIALDPGDRGTLLTIEFKVLAFAKEALGIHNVQLLSYYMDNGEKKLEQMSFSILVKDVFVATQRMRYAKEDVNQDEKVNVIDLMAVARSMRSPSVSNDTPAENVDSRADVNGDGAVNLLDLVLVYTSDLWGKAAPATVAESRDANEASAFAPAVSSNVDPAIIQSWIDLARVQDDGSAVFDIGIAKFEALLAARKPNDTKLLLNYPNPFNPETWIPYQLAEATNVTVTIHAMNGSLIRTLALGHQTAGVYKSKSRAAHWDGHNEFGEQVASGLYFYTLTAGDFSATGKMLVRK